MPHSHRFEVLWQLLCWWHYNLNICTSSSSSSSALQRFCFKCNIDYPLKPISDFLPTGHSHTQARYWVPTTFCKQWQTVWELVQTAGLQRRMQTELLLICVMDSWNLSNVKSENILWFLFSILHLHATHNVGTRVSAAASVEIHAFYRENSVYVVWLTAIWQQYSLYRFSKQTLYIQCRWEWQLR